MARASDYDSIGIGLPREWATLPIEQRAFENMCDDLRKRWRDDPDWDRSTERRAELLLARVRAEMRKVGIKAAAMYVELFGETESADARRCRRRCRRRGADGHVSRSASTPALDLETKLPLTLANSGRPPSPPRPAAPTSTSGSPISSCPRCTNCVRERRSGSAGCTSSRSPAACPTASTVSRSCFRSATTTRRAGSSTSSRPTSISRRTSPCCSRRSPTR